MFATDITFEKIVEKVKRMLGKNYKGDIEVVPVLSSPSPIEGHTDSFSTISNGGFTNDEVALIKDKIKNYAWWVANKGYLLGDSFQEIPALFIYGSEIGNIEPYVLNFSGSIENNFYLPIELTNMAGEASHASNHLYVRFLLDGVIQEYEIDRDGSDSSTIDINGTPYKIYSGRLYPEDKIIDDGNILYPIHLISNMDYYYISGETIENLGGAHDAEPQERNNLEILEDVCEMVCHEAAQWTNRHLGTNLLNDCWPVIVKCSCMAYLNRGAEGLNSQSELGQQNVYNDWIKLMHQQITNRRYVI